MLQNHDVKSQYSVALACVTVAVLLGLALAAPVAGGVGFAADTGDTQQTDGITVDRTVAQESVAPGGTTEVTVSVTADTELGFLAINENISPAATSTSLTAVELDNEQWTSDGVDTLLEADNASLFASDIIEDGQTVTFTYEVQVPEELGEHEITGSVGAGTAAGEEILDTIAPTTITVEEVPDGVAQYANEESGQVEIQGLRQAISDFTSDDPISLQLLRDVIAAFTSGEQVL